MHSCSGDGGDACANRAGVIWTRSVIENIPIRLSCGRAMNCLMDPRLTPGERRL